MGNTVLNSNNGMEEVLQRCLDRIARRVRELVIGDGKETKRRRMREMTERWRDERYERNLARDKNREAQLRFLWEHGEPYLGPTATSNIPSPGQGYEYIILQVTGGVWLPPCVILAMRNRYADLPAWLRSFPQRYPHFLDRRDHDYASRPKEPGADLHNNGRLGSAGNV